MSCQTTLLFYRTGPPPPKVVLPEIARFVSAFHTLGLSKEACTEGKIKFGRSIDQDDEPTTREVSLGMGISTYEDISWDLSFSRQDELADLAKQTDMLDRPIYRAEISLGRLGKTEYKRLARQPSDEETRGLGLADWSLRIEPILSYDLGSVDRFHVGWITVDLSGHGQLWPWSLPEVITRVEENPGIRDLQALCRETWPVKSSRTKWNLTRGRKRMRSLWPYDRTDLPLDWYWGVAEG